jgi:replicative DNA helicase
MIDRKPPQATELEEIVIGAVLLESDAIDTVAPILTDKCFYVPKNGLIWQSIIRLRTDREPIDMVTVVQRLKKDGYLEDAGGVMYISQLTNRVGSAVNIEAHARIVLQNYIKREIISICNSLAIRAFEDTADVFDLQDAIKNLYDFTLNHTVSGRDAVHILEAIKRDADAYWNRNSAKLDGTVTGVKTGLVELDRITMGWQNANLIVLAARPAMGKTSLAMHFARFCACPVLIFSIEMSEAQLTQRLVITESSIDGYDYKQGRLTEHQAIEVEHARGRLERLPMFIDDQTPITISDFKVKCLKFRRKNKGKILIVVDYLQLLKGDNEKGKNREQVIAEVSRGIKEVSKVCDCPVIALAQLNRSVEIRGGSKRPQLSDLRESGQIEQDADMVLFIHRPEYYGEMRDEAGNDTTGKAEIIVAKNRDGATGSINVGFIGDKTKFVDLDYLPEKMLPNADFLSPF